MRIDAAGFTEAGGAAALTGAAAGYDDAATTLGARVETALAANRRWLRAACWAGAMCSAT